MILCVYIPNFATTVERQTHASHIDAPIVLYAQRGQKRSVYAVSSEAKHLGVTVGMTPCACVVSPCTRNPCSNQALCSSDTLCSALLTITAHLEYELNQALTIWLGLGNVSNEDAHKIGSLVEQILKNTYPVSPQMGIANGHWMARLAAFTAKNSTVHSISGGNEYNFLAPLLLKQFALGYDLSRQFEQLGITTLAQLAQLPYNAVRTRFGQRGAQLHRLVNGHDRSTIARFTLPERECLTRPYEPAITNALMVKALLKESACHLMQTLTKRQLACQEITLTIGCEKELPQEQSRVLRQSIQSADALGAELIRLFSQMKITSGITALTITLDRIAPPVPQQLDFLDQLFGDKETSIQHLTDHLMPRHGDEPFHRLSLTEEQGYLPERNISLESVVAA